MCAVNSSSRNVGTEQPDNIRLIKKLMKKDVKKFLYSK